MTASVGSPDFVPGPTLATTFLFEHMLECSTEWESQILGRIWITRLNVLAAQCGLGAGALCISVLC
jgi:hypothetical protein